MFKSAKDFFITLMVTVTMGLVSLTASAESALPAGAFTTATANAIDTAQDVSTQLIPMLIGIMVAFAILGWSRKGFSKAGVR